MSYTTIEEYNNYLVIKKKNVNIIEYVKEINELTFKIDISFMNDFIELVYKDTCCIHHSMLKKYGVSNLTGGSSEVNVIMKQYGFIIDKDYQLRNVPELRIQGGTSIKNNYYLHPDTFKICCQRAKNTLVYSKYFVLLEKGMAYYRDYQNIKEMNILKENYECKMEKQNIKLDELNDQIKTLLIHSKKQMVKSDKILKINIDIKKDSKRTKKQLNTITEVLVETKEELIESHKKIDNITEVLIETKEELIESHKKIDNITEVLIETKEELIESHKKIDNITEVLVDTRDNVRLLASKLEIAVVDRVRRSDQPLAVEELIIMKSNTDINKYYVIRGQKRHIKIKVKLMTEYHEVKTIKCVPNAITLFNLIKQNMKDTIHCKNNKLNLSDITEDAFLEELGNIYDERLIVD